MYGLTDTYKWYHTGYATNFIVFGKTGDDKAISIAFTWCGTKGTNPPTHLECIGFREAVPPGAITDATIEETIANAALTALPILPADICAWVQDRGGPEKITTANISTLITGYLGIVDLGFTVTASHISGLVAYYLKQKDAGNRLTGCAFASAYLAQTKPQNLIEKILSLYMKRREKIDDTHKRG
jgi:hypothetical protein